MFALWTLVDHFIRCFDATILCPDYNYKTFFIYFLEKLPLLRHKQFLSFFKNLVVNNIFIHFPFFFVKGFFLDVRGKVGVAGNSKKRHFCFTVGSLKHSTKNFRLEYKHDIVRTVTGCLGITMFFCY